MIKAISMHILGAVGCDQDAPIPSQPCSGALKDTQITTIKLEVEQVTYCVHVAGDQVYAPDSEVGMAICGVLHLCADHFSRPTLSRLADRIAAKCADDPAPLPVDVVAPPVDPDPADPASDDEDLSAQFKHTVVHYHGELLATSGGCADPDHDTECDSYPPEVRCTGPVGGLFTCKHR